MIPTSPERTSMETLSVFVAALLIVQEGRSGFDLSAYDQLLAEGERERAAQCTSCHGKKSVSAAAFARIEKVWPKTACPKAEVVPRKEAEGAILRHYARIMAKGDEDARRRATEHLGNVRIAGSFVPVTKVLANALVDPVQSVKVSAADAFFVARDPASLPALKTAIDRLVKGHAEEAKKKAKGKKPEKQKGKPGEQTVKPLPLDPSELPEKERHAAELFKALVRAIANTPGNDSALYLLSLLENPSGQVVAWSVEGLRSFTGSDTLLRRQVVETLIQLLVRGFAENKTDELVQRYHTYRPPTIETLKEFTGVWFDWPYEWQQWWGANQKTFK
jgi:hypothetical protein